MRKIGMRYFLLIFSFFISFSADSKEFKYTGGQCIDSLGNPGLNQVSQEQLEESLDGECGDFRNALLNLHFSNSLDQEKMINLRGAVIGDINLQFIVVSADFSGADISINSLGYHTVKGIADEHSSFLYRNVLLGGVEVLDLGVGTFCLSDSSGCK